MAARLMLIGVQNNDPNYRCVGAIIKLGILRTRGEIAAVFPDPFACASLWLVFGLFGLLIQFQMDSFGHP